MQSWGRFARRRRPRPSRWFALLTVAVVAVAAVAFALTESGGTASQRHHPRPVAHRAPPPRPRPHKPGLQQVMAKGNAKIRQLARLGLPVWCAGKRGRDVAFTFDDGPGPYTRLVVKKLRQAHERATFFVVGTSMEAWPGLLPSELKVGAIGDHTYSHPDLTTLPPAEIKFQLQRDMEMIQAQSGEHADLFRAPYGDTNSTVEAIAKRLGLLPMMWTQDSRDSLGANWKQIIENVKNGLHPGAIILFHENHGQTVRALTTLLPLLHRRHLQSVSLPQLFATDPPSPSLIRGGFYACWPPDKVPKPIGGIGASSG